MSIEHRLDLGGSLVVVSRELDFRVSRACDCRQGALDVLRHQIADRIELNADLGNAVGGASGPTRGKHGARGERAHRPDEFAAVDHNSLRFIASTADAAARAVSAIYG